MTSTIKSTVKTRDHTLRTLLFKLYVSFPKKLKIKTWTLLLLMLVCGITETLSIASVFPFLAILSGETRFDGIPFSPFLNYLRQDSSNSQFIILVGTLFAFFSFAAFVVRLATVRFTNVLTVEIGLDLSKKVLKNILNRPYSFHLTSNSSYLISIVTDYTNSTVQALASILQLSSAVLISGGILSSLLIVDWRMTIVLLTGFGCYYISISSYVFKIMRGNGLMIAESSAKSLKTLQESLGSIRDILLNNDQTFFTDLFIDSDRKYRKAQSSSVYWALFPRYSLEFLGFLVIAILGVWLRISASVGSSPPVAFLGTIAVAFQRLLPAFQQVFSGFGTINGAYSAIQINSDYISIPSIQTHYPFDELIALGKGLELRNVGFCYDNTINPVLKDVNIFIKKGEKVGVIGASGSGKSTLVDIIMGLHKPTSGKLFLNNKEVYGSNNSLMRQSLSKAISHVPQSLYLIDGSIVENIAFGVEQKSINLPKIKSILKCVLLYSFIDSLPQKWDTYVGEKGLLLSGGQIQRIGMARAMYRDPELLIIDEGTNGLDKSTEASVLANIYAKYPDLTVIIIAHNNDSLVGVNRVIRVANGNTSDSSLM